MTPTKNELIYFTVGAIIFFINGYHSNTKPPVVITEKVYVKEEITQSQETEKIVNKEKKKEIKPDGTITETESESTIDINKFFEHREKFYAKLKSEVPVEPKWLIGASVSYNLDNYTPSYGVMFGGKLPLNTLYWSSEIWPTEKRAELSLIKLLK